MANSTFKPVQMKMNALDNSVLYREFKPSENLRKYIYCYWVSPSLGDGAVSATGTQKQEFVIPDGCIDILLGTNKEGESCRNILVGTMSKGITVSMECDSIQTFGVRFYPGGLQAFFSENASHFTDSIEFVDTIQHKALTEFAKIISTINGIYNKINYANKYFTSIMRDNIPWENQFQNILNHIYNTKGMIQVKEIARGEAISEKQLTRIISNRVGVNTKTFIKTVRFQNALNVINTSKTVRIVDLALAAGYYDQSHFINDFYAFCSINPSEYLKKIQKL